MMQELQCLLKTGETVLLQYFLGHIFAQLLLVELQQDLVDQVSQQ